MLQPTSLSNITNTTDNEQSGPGPHGAQTDVDRKFAAIFAPTIQLQAEAHRAYLWGPHIRVPMAEMERVKPLWEQAFQLLTNQLLARVAKEHFDLLIDQGNAPLPIYHDQGIG